MRPIGPASPMQIALRPRIFFDVRQVGQVGPVAFPRVKRRKTGGAPSRQQPTVGLDRPAKLRNVVAEHFAESARLQEIPLHVDDQQRAMVRAQCEGIRLGREFGRLHGSRPVFGETKPKGGPHRQKIGAFTAAARLPVNCSIGRLSPLSGDRIRSKDRARRPDKRLPSPGEPSAHRVAMNADPVCGMCTKTVLRR